MPGLVMAGSNGDKGLLNEPNGHYTPYRDQSSSSHGSDSLDLPIDAAVDTSIQQLYLNVCEMESSDYSPSRLSLISYGEDSRIESELGHLVGVNIKEVTKEGKVSPTINYISHAKEKFGKPSGVSTMNKAELENQDLEPSLLKQLWGLIASRNKNNLKKALKFALKAVNSFEKRAPHGEPGLELVMCLHILAAIYCCLRQHGDAIPVLERSIEIPVLEEGQSHALAKFSGCMRLGDTYSMLGQTENAIMCYTAGLEIQRQALGETDPQLGETLRYVAEAHVQALQFDEAARLCQTALDIGRENGFPSSLEEAWDRRLMGLICDSKGDHEAALEHYVLASVAMATKGNETELASIDCCIGDAYLALARYDEAIFAYRKALNTLKSCKRENHPAAALVYAHMAGMYNKVGKFKYAKSYCEKSLRIYDMQTLPQAMPEEVASGLIDISGIYLSLGEPDQAIKLLHKAQMICSDGTGQQTIIAGIEAQMGAMYYMMGNYSDSCKSLKNAASKIRACGVKKSAFLGITLNQMGLACLQSYQINEAADLFEEARSILEKEYGPYHPETLAVYSNLAGTYDAMGRLGDAIEILEYVVGIREDKLGTADSDVVDEKRRLSEMLKGAGRIRNKKFSSLATLLDTNASPE